MRQPKHKYNYLTRS